jgi:glutathione S-transferase
MAITLYELAGADPDLRFSPYCWRTRFALAHKGLEVEGIPWRFTESEKLVFSGQAKVPVIVDEGRSVADSWAIAEYLEARYPDRPSLFGGAAGQAHARFLNAWTDRVLHAGLARLVVRDILDVLHPDHQPYFRRSRERALGRSLEEVVADPESGIAALRKLLVPLRDVLQKQPWLGGEAPDYADYIVLGSLQWPRCVSPIVLLAEDDPVHLWQLRGLALFDGLGARAPKAT